MGMMTAIQRQRVAKLTLLFSFGALTARPSTARAEEEKGILETYPQLQKFIPLEHRSDLYFGFGVSPLTLVNNKIGISASLFQVHWMHGRWDLEFFNASFSTVFGSQYGNEELFLLRAAPKFRLFMNVSVGPMAGMEFVHFSSVTAELNKNHYFAPTEPLSAVGAVYGGVISETFNTGRDRRIKLNEMLYKETYSATGTSNGWTYHFDQTALNADSSPLAASTVFMLEISYLY